MTTISSSALAEKVISIRDHYAQTHFASPPQKEITLNVIITHIFYINKIQYNSICADTHYRAQGVTVMLLSLYFYTSTICAMISHYNILYTVVPHKGVNGFGLATTGDTYTVIIGIIILYIGTYGITT